MLKDSDFVLAYRHETYVGKAVPLGIRIFVATGERKLTEAEELVISKAEREIFDVLYKGYMLQNGEDIEVAKEEKKAILDLFGDRKIYVEEIPNGYCGQPCCINKTWFIVTTSIGHIKIGWRSHVLSTDWSKTHQKKTAAELFPKEEVTKGEYDIHAWSCEKAKQYLDTIHNS